MSTMEISSGAAKSTLNPNAPLFIPAALQQVEDFSPEWWELVKTTSWFRDHWFCQYQEQETFNGHQEEGGVAKLLPDSFELGTANDFSQFDTEFEEEAALFEAAQIENELAFTALKKEKEKVKSGSEMDAKELDLGNSTESSGEACGESSQKVLG